MSIKLKIKKGDKVKILVGDKEDKGKIGEVKQVFPKTSQVIVVGHKLAKKAIKPTEKNPKGGFEMVEMPMHISNVVKVEE